MKSSTFTLLEVPIAEIATYNHLELYQFWQASACLNDPKVAWKRLLKMANLEKVRIHDLRHTNASIALQAKVPLEIISKRLGHSSIQTTMRYAHLADDQIRQATNDLSSKLGDAMGM